MKFYLGVTGSLSHSSAILAAGDGKFVAEYTNLVKGLHYREMSDGVLYFALNHLIKSLGLKASQALNLDSVEIYSRLKRVVVAISGLDERFDPLLLAGTLSQVLDGCEKEIVIRSIGEACHCGAFLGEPGILVRLGVGCSVFGQDSEGKKHLTNAWGFLPGDLGASYHIGQQTLHLLTRAYDGRAKDDEKAFAYKVLENIGEDSVPALFDSYRRESQFGGHGTMAAIATLAHPVFSLESSGNPIARNIIRGACKEVVDGIRAVSTELRFGNRVELVFQGSLVEKYPSYVSSIVSSVRSEMPDVIISQRPPSCNRTVGVGLLALELPPPGHAFQLSPLGKHFLDTVDSALRPTSLLECRRFSC